MLGEIKTIINLYSCSTYAESIQLLVNHLPKVAIVDIDLPDNEGIKLLKYMKQFDPFMHVIVLTNLHTTYYRDLCRKLGAIHFADKSFDFDTIPALVNLLLSQDYKKN